MALDLLTQRIFSGRGFVVRLANSTEWIMWHRKHGFHGNYASEQDSINALQGV